MLDHHVLNWALIGVGVFFVLRLRRGLATRYGWYFAISVLGIITVSMESALESFGVHLDPRDRSGLDPRAAAAFYGLILVDVASRFVGLLVVDGLLRKGIESMPLPSITIQPRHIFDIALMLSFLAVCIQVYLQIAGHIGYFRNPVYDIRPPEWLDVTQKSLVLGFGFYFLTVINFVFYGRRGVVTVLLGVAWMVSGFLSGFKGQVFLPIFMFAISSWLCTGRPNWKYLACTLAALVAAYSVIEPLREVRTHSPGVIGAFGGYAAMMGSKSSASAEPADLGSTIGRVITRIDQSENGISALSEFQAGRLARFAEEQAYWYENFLAMALVPRALWPDKPLGNLGQILFSEMYVGEGNSITLPTQVGVFIWGGVAAVIGFGFINGAFLAIASVLMMRWREQPVRRFLVLFFALSLSFTDDYQIIYLIDCLRSALAVFFVVAFGLLAGAIRLIADVEGRDRGWQSRPSTPVRRNSLRAPRP